MLEIGEFPPFSVGNPPSGHPEQSCNFIQVIVGVLIGDIQCQFCDFSPKQPHLQN